MLCQPVEIIAENSLTNKIEHTNDVEQSSKIRKRERETLDHFIRNADQEICNP